MKRLHNILLEKIKKAEKLPKTVSTDLSNLYTKEEVDNIVTTIPSGGVEEAPVDTKTYGRKDAGWAEIILSGFSGTMDDITDGATYVKTHLDLTTTKEATWNGKSNLALGETNTTAYRGDRGKTAYDHSQVAHAPDNADNTYSAINGASAANELSDDNKIATVNEGGEIIQIITYANLRDQLKSYFDSIYTPL